LSVKVVTSTSCSAYRFTASYTDEPTKFPSTGSSTVSESVLISLVHAGQSISVGTSVPPCEIGVKTGSSYARQYVVPDSSRRTVTRMTLSLMPYMLTMVICGGVRSAGFMVKR